MEISEGVVPVCSGGGLVGRASVGAFLGRLAAGGPASPPTAEPLGLPFDSFGALGLTSPFHDAGGDGMEAFDQAVEKYHASLLDFVKGNAEPALQMFSQRDDVVLCNPFWPFAHGPAEVAEAARAAAANFADGEYTFETVETYVTSELGYIVEVERFKGTIGGKEGSGRFASRRSFDRKATVGASLTDTPTR